MLTRRAPIIDLVMPGFGTVYNALLNGIRRYADAHTRWRLNIHHLDHGNIEREVGHGTDGVLSSPQIFYYHRKTRLRCPVVFLDEFLPVRRPKLPYVAPDNFRIGQLAADHLLTRGLPNFAFIGREGLWSRDRQRGFEQTLTAAGRSCTSTGRHQSPDSFPAWNMLTSRRWIRRWLSSLPRPVAVLICQDELAPIVFEAADELGWQISRDWIVMGVNGFDLQCGHPRVSLTSIDLNYETLAFEAARLLDQILRGLSPTWPVIVPPGHLVPRESTDSPILNDPDLHEALRIVRQPTPTRLTVDELAQRVALSRSTIERRYRRATGLKLGQSIRRVRIERVSDMLRNTNLPIWRIAEECGYSSSAALSRAFTNACGQSPSAWRAAHSAARSPSPGNPPKQHT